MAGSAADHARRIAEAVLVRIDGPASSWRVLSVEPVEPVTEPPEGLRYPGVLSVRLGPADGEPVGVHYTLDVDEPSAVAAVADQIQSHVIESAQGAALPPCPGHHHPLTVRVIDQVACWACPNDDGHHREPVLGHHGTVLPS